MKIDIKTLKYWTGKHTLINDIIIKLTNIGFESFLEKNIINISIPYNRANCSNIFSIINEINFFYNLSFNRKKKHLIKNNKNYTHIDENYINIDKNFCKTYIGLIINDFNNKIKTPIYIKNLLKENNIKINNFLVDITNYILLTTGQPSHIYDLDKIHGKIKLDILKKNTYFTTINNIKIKLKKNCPIFCDDKNILCLPGIIGSNISKIDSTSKNILIEFAIFDKEQINELVNIYKINTLSSNIFKHGVNTKNIHFSVNFLISILNKYNKSNKIFFFKKKICKLFFKKIILYKKKLINILGFNIIDNLIEKILIKKRFKFKKFNNLWKIYVPYHRYDITITENIISEILRYYDCKNIPLRPLKDIINIKINNKNTCNIIINYLHNIGFNEVINYTFVNKQFEDIYFKEKKITIKNPISENMNVMRVSMLQNLLKNVTFNLNRYNKNIKFFELGNVWNNNNINASLNLSCICSDNFFYKELYNSNNTFYILKNISNNILNKILKYKNIIYKKNQINYLDSNISNTILINKKKIGTIGLINQTVLNYFNIKEKLYFLEINLNKIINNLDKKIISYKTISKYPKIERDVSFILLNTINYQDLTNVISQNKIKFLKEYKLINIYNLDNNKKSITIKFIFQSFKKTLTDIEINNIIYNIYSITKNKFNLIVKGL